MSLAVLADHMASKGRGPDSMLIHMSPTEVQGLQALAMKHGGSLTINPETGLPEAGFLDKLLPAIIGFALAPLTAGTSLAFLGATPFASALTVGGLQTLRTGDIGKGIQAGLGAYGGAGLQASLAGAGASALGSEAAKAGAGLTGDMAFNLADAGVTDAGIQSLGNVEAANQALQQQAAERVAAATPYDKLAAGFDAAKANPSSLLTKDNFKYMAALAGPIMADQAVKSNMPQTVTQPGMIAPSTYDPISGRFTQGNPYQATPNKAAGGGLMGMDDGGYGPGQLDFTQKSEPVVRMAEGGIARFVNGGKVITQDDAYKLYTQARQTAGTQPGGALDFGTTGRASDDSVTRSNAYVTQAGNTALAGLGYGMDQSGNITGMGKAITPDDLYKLYIQARQTAAIQPGGALNFGGTGRASDDSVTRSNAYQTQAGNAVLAGYGYEMDKNGEIVPIGTATTGTGTTTGTGNTAGTTVDTTAALAAINAARGTQTSDVGNTVTTDGTYRSGVPGASAVAATPKVGDVVGQGVYAGVGTPLSTGTSGPIVDFGGKATFKDSATGRAISPLDLARENMASTAAAKLAEENRLLERYRAEWSAWKAANPNATPREEANFIDRLGLSPEAVARVTGRSPQEQKNIYYDAKYNTLTGGSKQAYDYLTGKTPYSATPYTTTGEVMKPYAESVLGVKLPSASKAFLFDPATRTYKVNPDYAIPTFDSAGKKSYATTNKDVTDYLATNPTGSDFATWMTSRNLSLDQIAAATDIPISTLTKKYAGNITTATAAAGNPIPFADLYQSVLNRPGDDTGLAYWKSRFGDTVDADELAIFKAAARASGELKDDTATTATTATTTTTGNSIPFADLYQSVLKRDGDATGLAYWKSRFGDTVDDDELAVFKAAARSSGELKAANGGLMALADGGITGNGQLNLNIPLNLGGSGGAGVGGYSAMGSGFSGYQGQSSQNSVQQSGIPEFRNQMQGIEAQIQKLPSVMAYGDYTKSLGNRQPTTDEMAQIEQLRKGITGDRDFLGLQSQMQSMGSKYQQQAMGNQSSGLQQRYMQQTPNARTFANGGMSNYDLGGYSDGGRLLRGPGDGVSDSIPATIGNKRPARLADGEFVVPARIVSELGNGSTEAGARKLYAMMDRVQAARRGSIGKGKVAKNSRADKYLPA